MVHLHEPDPAVANRPRVALTYALAALVAFLVIAATAFGTYLIVDARNPHPFDPLRYPETERGGQVVLTRVPGVKGPAVRVGGHVHVQGTACNLSDRPVGIRGRLFWTIVQPPGFSILVSHADAIRFPGCKDFDYENAMPPVVQRVARERGPGVLWRINGDVTPVNAHGVTRLWQTQAFRIVP